MSSMSAAVPSDAYLPIQDRTLEDGTLALQQAFAQSMAQVWPAKIRMELDPDKYRSSSQGPDRGVPVSVSRVEIERVIDRLTKTDGWMPIIPQYQGATAWARSAWKGTILEHLWIPALWSFLIPLFMIGAARRLVPSARWLPSPPAEHPLFATLLALSHGWVHLLTLTTFTTTFFLGHAHAFWNKCYLCSRIIQGRLNDVGMLCGSHAARTADGVIEPEAAALLTQVARQLRLAHILFWADVVYRRTQNKGASFRTLLSASGLQQLHARGLLDKAEYEALRNAQLPPSRWFMVVLEWVMAGVAQARREGLIVASPGWESTVLQKLCDLRASMMQLPDELAARIPLAYVHLTSLLVDALLILSPLALLPRTGAFTVVLCPLIVLFYSGLLELSKSFLDPFGNRRVSTTDLSAEINIDTLIGEANAGSLVWPLGAQSMPFLSRRAVPSSHPWSAPVAPRAPPEAPRPAPL